MGYLSIQNLYRPEAQTILLLKECYALEKIHGTSAHIAFRDGKLRYFSGGENHERFTTLFDEAKLLESFKALGLPPEKEIIIYGEAYGGKQQGMSHTYGKDLKFIVFDVWMGDAVRACWLKVPDAEGVAQRFGLEFVAYEKVSTDLTALDAVRDKPSVQAVRNGITEPKSREGIVLRPLVELTTNNGERVIAKHKGAAFSETQTQRKVEIDAVKKKAIEDAQGIADEWVTHNRLLNAVTHFKAEELDMKNFRNLMTYLVEDVFREGAGEIPDVREVRQAISRKAADSWKSYLMKVRIPA